jgi:membrane-associated protein
VIARFVPIVRTFAPFVAGMGRMTYSTFVPYSFAGGVLWIGSLVYAGYFFGNLPFVRNNLSLVIIGIVVISILPGVIEYLRGRRARTVV